MRDRVLGSGDSYDEGSAVRHFDCVPPAVADDGDCATGSARRDSSARITRRSDRSRDTGCGDTRCHDAGGPDNGIYGTGAG